MVIDSQGQSFLRQELTDCSDALFPLPQGIGKFPHRRQEALGRTSVDEPLVPMADDDDGNFFDRRFLLDQPDGQITFFPSPVSQAEPLQRAVRTAGMLGDTDHGP